MCQQAIVFVATRTGTRWGMNATDHTRNWGRYDGSVLFALDRGDDNAAADGRVPGPRRLPLHLRSRHQPGPARAAAIASCPPYRRGGAPMVQSGVMLAGSTWNHS